jgi:FAD-dependent urate hydroxylase
VTALRILVIGAGVGGISVARGLLRDGHDVTVYEQRQDTRPGGGAVTIWPNGATVLDQLGVDMDAAGQLLSTVRIAASNGRPLVNISVDTIVDRLGGYVRMVPRHVLLDRLLEDFPTDRIRCNSRVVDAFTTQDGIRVEFEDGSHAHGDLLIGADGLHSRIRRIAGAPPAKPTGWCSWQGLSTVGPLAEKDVAVQMIGAHGSLGIWPAGGCDVQWWFDLRWRPDSARPEHPLDMIRSHFAGWSSLVDQVLATLTDGDLAPSPFPHHRHPIPRIPRAGAMTLLGDAAHAMPPILAQGTNQALLDAMLLRKALSDVPDRDLARALRWYEKTRRRRLTAVSWVTSRQMAQSEVVLRPAAMVSDSFGTWAMTTFLRSTSHPRICAEMSGRLTRS